MTRPLNPLNPLTTPLGVLMVQGLGTEGAVAAARDLESPATIEQAIATEKSCLARSAVLAALRNRLQEVRHG